MTIQEAIKAVVESNYTIWFRPVSLRGTGYAYVVNELKSTGEILLVPTARGGVPASFRSNDILGEWETVSPDVVNTE